jgi:phosphoglycerate dehydrogenase-like enzyme
MVGWGNTARHFARLLQPFDCKLLVHTEAALDGELEEFGASRASLAEVLGGAKIVSLHKGLTHQSAGSIGPRELALLSPGTVFINTARAALVQEDALLNRLEKGDIIAGLDVFHQEPLPSVHRLRRMKNVILSPHSAGTTPECARRVGRQALEIIQRYVETGDAPYIPVQRLARMS